MQQFQQTIEEAWENRNSFQPGKAPAKLGEAVSAVKPSVTVAPEDQLAGEVIPPVPTCSTAPSASSAAPRLAAISDTRCAQNDPLHM